MNTRTKHIELGLKVYKKGKDRRAHPSPRLLLELERMLDSTLDPRQGFAYATNTKLKYLHVENYK
jgi:hypothetical protein